ncbi:hypothetical protein psyc5s11_36270 [Clostridium gelidum]|uniref:Uncharacterized protein n=1 Tax=Clostridium gelidum TaxID=704125 RepID=A0ABN6IZL9_9CLOT|nr:hypothetical protein [Clostridium gelidum]BCZ47560.1 hypothetical protein psyc5s11_36270 [Clostridium gelidum]
MKANLKLIILSMTIILLTMTPITTVKAYEITLNIPKDNTSDIYNVNIAVINHSNDCNIVIVQNDKEYYSFITDDNTFKVGEALTITVNSSGMVTQAKPYVSKRDNYKLGDNGITYVNKLTTNGELQEYATRWLKDNYNMTLDIPVEFNSAKQNNNADYIVYGQTFYNNDKPVKIIIDYSLNTNSEDKNIIKERMLIHELTHYALAKQGLPYEDNTVSFTTEALKNGASIDDKDNTAGILHSHILINQNL